MDDFIDYFNYFAFSGKESVYHFTIYEGVLKRG